MHSVFAIYASYEVKRLPYKVSAHCHLYYGVHDANNVQYFL